MNHFRAAQTAVLLGILAGCGGGGNGGGTTPPPTGNPPQTTTSRLTLTGTVTDAPIANAVVTATVGGQTFTANADANGNYRLEISLAQDATGGFVTLTAKGVGAQSYVEFTSLLGTFSALLTQAGSDATLSSTENFATQITNVTTALAVLLREANNGQTVASETLIQTLSASLNSQDLLDLATAIKLLVDHAEDYPMPDGQASMTALLSNTAVREELVDAASSLDRAMFVATQNAIVTDPTVVKPIATGSVPSSLLATTLPNDLNGTYYQINRAVAYVFNANGTGTVSTGAWHRNMTWSVTNGAIEISYATPVEMWDSEFKVCLPIGYGYTVQELPLRYNVAGATLRQLSDHILTVTEDREITARDCGPVGETETVTVARTIIDASNTQSIEPSDLRDSTRTLWVYDAASDVDDDTLTVKVMPDIADLHADGTGRTHVFDKAFTWALDASGKVVTATFADGTVAKYRSVRNIDDVTTDVLYDLALPTGVRNVGSSVSFRVDPQQPFSWTRNNVVGRQYSLGIGEEGVAVPKRKGYGFRLAADGTGSIEDDYVDEAGNVEVMDGSQNSHFQLIWFIDDQDLIVQRTYTPVGPENYGCSLATDPTCVVYDHRRFIPIANDGARTYSLVARRTDHDGVNAQTSSRTYVAMYEFEPFGDVAPSGKPALAAKARAQLKELRDRR
ncbi:carboxypeptidase-like regulatory domain-containing protein [Steroidobacter flavus]|uniref:Carboxypeptidase-like regulatory domain-containing protein n=1 Tax=Steroidobacter flavus TaxID=1842136 RepID=A0ABV8SJB4_9GAMM